MRGPRPMRFPVSEVTFNHRAGAFGRDVAHDNYRGRIGLKHALVIIADIGKGKRRNTSGRGVAEIRIVFRKECRFQGVFRKIGWALKFSRHAVGNLALDDFEGAGGQSRMQFILR